MEHLIRQKEKVARLYNRRIRFKKFKEGDLVWKVILPIDKHSRAFGKWSPNWEGLFKVTKKYAGNAYAIVDVNSNLKVPAINEKYLKEYKPIMYEVKIS